MDDMRPQDVHFAWDDIMAYKASTAPKTSRTPHHLSVSGYTPSRQEKDPREDGYLYDSDVDASQWSETETSLSTGPFSIDSRSTHTSGSLSGLECCFGDDEDEIEFPSYHDAPACARGRMPELCNPFPPLASSQPGLPETIQHADDDSAVQTQPSRHVDYLSHDWREEDVAATWRMKDRDVTWLYGPLQLGEELDGESAPPPVPSETPSPPVRPILKKPTLSETLLRRSLSVSCLVKVPSTASIQTQRSAEFKNDSSTHPLPAFRRPKPKVTFSFDSISDWSRRSPTPTKNVRFHDEIEQHSDFGPIDFDEGDIEVSALVNHRHANATELRRALIVGGIPLAVTSEPIALADDLERGDDNLETDSNISMESDSESAESEHSHDDSEDDYFGTAVNFSRAEISHMGSLLGPVRDELVELVMSEFWTLFNREWDSSFTECAGNSPRSPKESRSGPHTTPSTSGIQAQRKRQRMDDGDNRDDNSGRKPRQPPQLPVPGSEGKDSPKFACPFRKCDANTYNIYSYRVCALSHWKTIARVKEHLYRCHQVAPHCKRCWQTFKNQQQLDTHLTVAAQEICEIRPGNSPEGITPEIERRLRSRKKSHPNQTDEERWKDIYKLLFPNATVPSPYFEIVQDEPPSSPDSRELANYEGYLRRELPRLVRSNIEEVVRRETQPLEAVLVGSLVGIIQDCQDRVFRAYRETQGFDPSISTPSIATLTSTPLPEAICTEDTQARAESDFLDAAFQAPVPTPEQRAPYIQPFELSDYKVFSDSGYSSEPICSCRSLCSCTRSTFNTQLQDDPFSVSQDNSNISRPWAQRPTNSLSYPSWQHVELTEDEADWWMNI
ncbi:uncharacterized protein BP5553_10605 [Venustampulla echinocandica]|uniref:C2H2-type domain-containing protein n=1 Tax=Venustampulla echinocandica TaxID=2656787 RepID=A0A370T911_9HELO|nr:uncharacterized protein BP5553_10605 [Venustampulla echinocandica]RDL29978.1 hypothetical protein BP5553_10605 [Venustampulla echinocandica]